MTASSRPWWKCLPPSGPVISLLLIGMVLLSAVLYYRAVKIQRFLEPALALSRPRNEFTKRITRTFQEVFGQTAVRGIRLKAGTIQMDRTLLFSEKGALTPWSRQVLHNLGRVYLTLLRDERTRSEISHILITARFPNDGMRAENIKARMDIQLTASFIHETLLRAEPELARSYSSYFSAGAQPVGPRDGNPNRLDFTIVPSEFLHIEVLERLEKYAH